MYSSWVRWLVDESARAQPFPQFSRYIPRHVLMLQAWCSYISDRNYCKSRTGRSERPGGPASFSGTACPVALERLPLETRSEILPSNMVAPRGDKKHSVMRFVFVPTPKDYISWRFGPKQYPRVVPEK